MSAGEPAGTRVDNQRNTELLDAELPSPRFVDDAYLHWLYDENPFGPAIQRAVDDDGVRVAHYAVVPQRYRDPDGVVPAGFSLNAVVRSGTQRQGWFRKLGLGDLRGGSGRRLAVRRRCVQRQVDRRGRQVHGLEDTWAVAGAGDVPAPVPQGGREPLGRPRVPRRQRLRAPDRGTRPVPR